MLSTSVAIASHVATLRGPITTRLSERSAWRAHKAAMVSRRAWPRSCPLSLAFVHLSVFWQSGTRSHASLPLFRSIYCLNTTKDRRWRSTPATLRIPHSRQGTAPQPH